MVKIISIMNKINIGKKIIRILVLLVLISFNSNDLYAGRRCTGSSGCSACTNCNGCKYCNEGGGTCGVCSSSSSYEVYTPPVEHNTSKYNESYSVSEPQTQETQYNENSESDFDSSTQESEKEGSNWLVWLIGIIASIFIISKLNK